MKKIVILGAGGHAHVIADIVRAEGNEVVAFLDDNLYQQDCSGPISDYTKYGDCEFVIGIGSNSVREKLSSLNVIFHTAIHPRAIISPSAKIGSGTVVMPNAVINCNAVVGKHCIINTSSVVEHDNRIADYCHISVGTKLGGTVVVGQKTFIGLGASVKNNVTIQSDVTIGCGSTVIHDITESGVYVGTPVRRLK